MSKRKSRTSAPNLPQETLERARRQAAIARGELPPEPEPEPPVAEPPSKAAPAVANPYRTIAARQRRVITRTRSRAGERRARVQDAGRERRPELDAERISELLENPTIEVTEEELRREYTYVLTDLRSMGLLAAGLFVTLIVLAQVLPQ